MINIIKRIILFLQKKYNNIFFLCSTDILPSHLCKEDEINYLIKAKEGDIKARNILIEHNLRLVVFIAKKYENIQDSLEDLVSIGSIGLIKGINTYKIDKNIRLATYASRCISNEILMYIRKNKKRNADVSFEEALSYDGEGNELKLEDIIGTGDDIVSKDYERKVDISILEENLNKLNDRERSIMIMRYGLNNCKEYTQKEVADILGISQSYISRIEKKVIKNLKACIDVIE